MRKQEKTNGIYGTIEKLGNWLMTLAIFASLNLLFFYQPAQGSFVRPLAKVISIEIEAGLAETNTETIVRF